MVGLDPPKNPPKTNYAGKAGTHRNSLYSQLPLRRNPQTGTIEQLDGFIAPLSSSKAKKPD
jgi:hypothetical protein